MRQNLSSRFPTKRLKPVSSAVASLDLILSKKRLTKALISLRGCAGLSAPLLFANPEAQISCLNNEKQMGLAGGFNLKIATDACLTADPGVASSIPARSHTFVEIDHEIISTVILLPSADSFKKGCCQLQAKVCAQITG